MFLISKFLQISISLILSKNNYHSEFNSLYSVLSWLPELSILKYLRHFPCGGCTADLNFCLCRVVDKSHEVIVKLDTYRYADGFTEEDFRYDRDDWFKDHLHYFCVGFRVSFTICPRACSCFSSSLSLGVRLRQVKFFFYYFRERLLFQMDGLDNCKGYHPACK